jgi:hypothetical protein
VQNIKTLADRDFERELKALTIKDMKYDLHEYSCNCESCPHLTAKDYLDVCKLTGLIIHDTQRKPYSCPLN